MHKQLFVPPGAGKNFISYHVMWLGDKSNVFGYNETIMNTQLVVLKVIYFTQMLSEDCLF